MSDAKKKAQNKYIKNRCTQINITLNLKNDADIIEYWSKQENKRQKFFELTRKAIEEES